MLNSIPVFAAVCSTATSSSRCTSGASSSARPIDAETDVVPQERVQLQPEVALQERHQRGDFRAGPLPVLDRERVERQYLDADARRRFDDIAYRVDAGSVAFDARQVALGRPPAVAVHDDRDVSRQLIEVDLPGQGFFGRSWRDPGQELLKRHQIPLP